LAGIMGRSGNITREEQTIEICFPHRKPHTRDNHSPPVNGRQVPKEGH